MEGKIHLRSLFLILFIFICIGWSFGQTGTNFRASVVKKDITPDDSQQLVGYGARKSTGIHDRIYLRIAAMDDGNSQFFIVQSDLCLISPAEYDKMAKILQEKFGIDRLNFWWSTTHTHSGPEVGSHGLDSVFLGQRYEYEVDRNYTRILEERLISGIGEALEKLAPAKLGVGWGYSQANINRRARFEDGRTTLGMNPDGPVDRRIGLIKLINEDGSLMGLIANYAMHGTVLGSQNLEISGDAPGIVAEYVEEKLGAPMLYINGAAGNIAPIYSVYPSPSAGHLNQFRVLLGDKIISASHSVEATVSQVKLNTGILIVETPRKDGLGWPESLSDYTRKWGADKNLVRLPIRFMKINEEIAVWSAPLELFCEISNEVRNRSPFPYTFYFGYTNGWLGYLLSEDEYQYGGYELSVSPYTSSAARTLTEAVSGYLQGEMKNSN